MSKHLSHVSVMLRNYFGLTFILPFLLPSIGQCQQAPTNHQPYPTVSSGSLEASMACTVGGGIETNVMPGPAGVSVALDITSDDDHAKDSHDCQSAYDVHVTPDPKPDGLPYRGLTKSIAEWDRKLYVRLEGFSADGKQVFGIIAEAGAYHFIYAFSYLVGSGRTTVYDLSKLLKRLESVRCGTSFRIIGTIKPSGIVVEPNTADRCRTKLQWSVAPDEVQPRPLLATQPVTPLFRGHAP